MTNLGNTIPNSTQRNGTNSFRSILDGLARFISGAFNPERKLKFVNNSIDYYLMMLDNPEKFTLGREALKSFLKSSRPIFLNHFRGVNSTREERMNLLKSIVKFAFAGFNIETIDIEKVFQLMFSSEKSKEETNAKLQPLVDLIFRNISTALREAIYGDVYIDEKGCGGVAKEMIRLMFTYLPSLLDTDGDKRADVESLATSQEKHPEKLKVNSRWYNNSF